jgi:hypothetical protein
LRIIDDCRFADCRLAIVRRIGDFARTIINHHSQSTIGNHRNPQSSIHSHQFLEGPATIFRATPVKVIG